MDEFTISLSDDGLFQKIKNINENTNFSTLFNLLDPKIDLKFIDVEFTDNMLKEVLFYNDFNIVFLLCKFDLDEDIEANGVKLFFNNCDFGRFIFLTNIKNSDLSFFKVKVNSLFIDECENITIEIDSCKIQDLRLNNSSFNDFALVDKNKIRNLKISNVSVNWFTSEESIIEYISIVSSKIKKISFKRCFGKVMSLIDEAKNENINEFTILDDLWVYDCGYELILIKGSIDKYSIIEKINLSNTDNIEFWNLKVNELSLWGGDFKNCRFYKLECNELCIDAANLVSDVLFLYLQVFEMLYICGSNLKGLVMNNSFFHQVKSIIFRDSSLIGCSMNEFKTFKNYKIIGSDQMFDFEKISFYRQLSLVMTSHNLYYLSKYYRSIELNLRIKYFSVKSVFDWLILFLNKITNNHGINPLRAFFCLIFSCLIFLYITFLETSINSGFQDFLIENYTFALNPIFNNIDLIVEYKSPLIGLFVFVYRVVYTYLIYQFVSSFRKFNK